MTGHLFLIGDTILNRTYRATPRIRGDQFFPATFLNEELLHASEPADVTIQGVGYISNFVAKAGITNITMITGFGRGEDARVLHSLITDSLSSHSMFGIDGEETRTTTRVLRDVSSTRLQDSDAAYRAQLRIDQEPHTSADMERIRQALRKHAARDDICLLRSLSPIFFGKDASETVRNLELIQEILLAADATLVMDVRPLPPGLKILDGRTTICTTIGRLRDRRATYAHASNDVTISDIEAIEGSIWKFAPASGVVCFTPDLGTLVVERGALHYEANIQKVAIEWPTSSKDGCGLVVAGDAWIGGIIVQLYYQRSLVEAAAFGNAAYAKAFGQPLGYAVDPGDVTKPPAAEQARVVRNPEADRLGRIIEGLARTRKYKGQLVYPENGALDKSISEIETLLRDWKPRKGRDLIAVFGESRSGKEFALREVLTDMGFVFLGPINLHQFLSEVRGCLNDLRRLRPEEPNKSVLVIDEVTPGDSARSLLNLMAEKKYKSYLTNDPEVDFANHPVILLSSIPPDQMLEDLRGRLWNRRSLTIPPLRDRWDELIIHMPGAAMRTKPDATVIYFSYRFLSVLLHHDWQPRRVGGGVDGTGLDQLNFRAFDDLMSWCAERADAIASPSGAVLRISFDHLPDDIKKIAAQGVPDDLYLAWRQKDDAWTAGIRRDEIR